MIPALVAVHAIVSASGTDAEATGLALDAIDRLGQLHGFRRTAYDADPEVGLISVDLAWTEGALELSAHIGATVDIHIDP